MRKILLISGSILSFATAPAFAQTQAKDEIVVVTANRSAKPLSQIGSSIVVINAARIAKLRPIQLLDLLAEVSSISFNRNGGIGSYTNVRIRGAEGEQTQIMYDGVRLNDPSLPSGGFDFGTLIANDIGRVEILKGPQSSLYGSDAIGGVINIFSRIPQSAFEARVGAEIGTLNSHTLRAGISGKSANLSYAISTIDYGSDSVSQLSERFGGRESDPFRNQGIAARLNYAISPNVNIDARANYAKSKLDFDGYPAPFYAFSDTAEYSKSDQGQFYLGLNTNSFSGRLQQTLSAKKFTSNRANFDTSLSPNTTYIAHGALEALEYQGNLTISERLDLVFGAGVETSKYSNRAPASWNPNPPSERQSASNQSAYVEAQFEAITNLNATIGVRTDKHEAFGGHESLRATLAYRPNEGNTIFRASYGDGYKAPTLFQLYSEYGNIALRPEQATSYDIGISQKFANVWQFGFSYFTRETRNQIGFFTCWPTTTPLCDTRPYGYYDNIASTETSGIEAEFGGKIFGVNLSGGLSQLSAKNTAVGDANFGKQLARRPKVRSFLSVSYDWTDDIETELNWQHSGEAFDDAANSRGLKAYDLLNFRASWQISPSFAIYGKIENLSDENYQTTYSYGTSSRTFAIGLEAKF